MCKDKLRALLLQDRRILQLTWTKVCTRFFNDGHIIAVHRLQTQLIAVDAGGSAGVVVLVVCARHAADVAPSPRCAADARHQQHNNTGQGLHHRHGGVTSSHTLPKPLVSSLASRCLVLLQSACARDVLRVQGRG